MNRRRRKTLLASIAMISMTALVWRACFFSPPPAHNLLERAIRLTDVQSLVSYSWLSSTGLLLQTSTNGYPRRTPWSGYLELIDARSRQRTRLDKLTAVILQHKWDYDPLGPWAFTRSNDGEWLFWYSRDPKNGGTYPVTARQDGSGYHKWRNLGKNSHHWIDGHRWVTDVSPKTVTFGSANVTPVGFIVHDAAQPGPDRLLPYSSPEAQALLKSDRVAPVGAPGGAPRPILFADPKDTRFHLDCAIMMSPSGSAPGIQPMRLDTVTFPAGTKIIDNIPNSQASRIELMVSETGVPAYVTFLRSFRPAYAYKGHPREYLYVYRSDNRELVDLGCVDENTSAISDLLNVFWLPDGKHIQFMYHNAVYIVSSD